MTETSPALRQLMRTLDMDTLEQLEALEQAGWALVALSSESFQFRHAESGRGSDLLRSGGDVMAEAQKLFDELSAEPQQQEAPEQPAPPLAPPVAHEPQESVVERLAASPRPQKFSAHEIDLRDSIVEELEAKGKLVRRNVEGAHGTAEVFCERTVYEFKCTPMPANLRSIIEEATRLRDGIDAGAALCIVCCCIDETDIDQLDKLREAAQASGISVDTWSYNANSDTLRIVNPVFQISNDVEEMVAAGAEDVEAARPPALAAPSQDVAGEAPLFPQEALSGSERVLVQQMEPAGVRTHPSLLMRAYGLDQEHVEELEEGYRAGRIYPPADVFFDGTDYWVADGNHRHAGALRAGALLDVHIHHGTFRDAVRFALKANSGHGLKLSNDDKRLKVVTVLADPEWFRESDTVLADIAGVTQPFVGNLRRQLARLLPLGGDESTVDPLGRLTTIVRRLSDDAVETLTQNVLGDDGRRRGSDGVVRSAPTRHAEIEEAAPPLFVQTGEENEALARSGHAPGLTAGATQQSAHAGTAQTDAEKDTAASPAPPAPPAAEVVHALHTGDEEVVARAEEAGTSPTPSAQEALPRPAAPETDETWDKATIVVTLKLMPHDGSPEGRRLLIVAHEEGGAPITELVRAGADALPSAGPVARVVERLKGELPARLSTAPKQVATPATAATPAASTAPTGGSKKTRAARASKKSGAKKSGAKKSARKPPSRNTTTAAGAK